MALSATAQKKLSRGIELLEEHRRNKQLARRASL